MDMWRSGATPTTEIGYLNQSNRKNHGTRGKPGSDHLQYTYRLECLVPGCGYLYGANGTHVFQRKCLSCEDGSESIWLERYVVIK